MPALSFYLIYAGVNNPRPPLDAPPRAEYDEILSVVHFYDITIKSVPNQKIKALPLIKVKYIAY